MFTGDIPDIGMDREQFYPMLFRGGFHLIDVRFISDLTRCGDNDSPESPAQRLHNRPRQYVEAHRKGLV